MTRKERHLNMVNELIEVLEKRRYASEENAWALRQAKRMIHTVELYGCLMPSQLAMHREWMHASSPGGDRWNPGYRNEKFWRANYKCTSRPKGKRP